MSNKKYTKENSLVRQKVLAIFKERGSERKQLNIFIKTKVEFDNLVELMKGAFLDSELIKRMNELYRYHSQSDCESMILTIENKLSYNTDFPILISLSPKCIETNDMTFIGDIRKKEMYNFTKFYSQQLRSLDYNYSFAYGITIAKICASQSSESFLKYVGSKNNEELDVINYKEQLKQ